MKQICICWYEAGRLGWDKPYAQWACPDHGGRAGTRPNKKNKPRSVVVPAPK